MSWHVVTRRLHGNIFIFIEVNAGVARAKHFQFKSIVLGGGCSPVNFARFLPASVPVTTAATSRRRTPLGFLPTIVRHPLTSWWWRLLPTFICNDRWRGFSVPLRWLRTSIPSSTVLIFSLKSLGRPSTVAATTSIESTTSGVTTSSAGHSTLGTTTSVGIWGLGITSASVSSKIAVVRKICCNNRTALVLEMNAEIVNHTSFLWDREWFLVSRSWTTS